MKTMKVLPPRFLSLILLSFVLLWLASSAQSSSAQGRVYSFGVVPQFEVRKLRKVWQPIVNYLEKETGYTFEILGSPTIGEFEQELLQGDFDFAYVNPLHLILANERVGYLPLVRDSGKKLHGILVVKKDSGITDVSQLDEKTIIFPAPRALGATLLVKQELDSICKIKIHSIYARTHDSVYLNVLLGNVAVGGGVQQTFNRQPAEYRSALQIIYKTRNVPSHPIVVHPAVPCEVATAVQLAFLKLGSGSEGKALLAAIPIKNIVSAELSEYLTLKAAGLERYYENEVVGLDLNE